MRLATEGMIFFWAWVVSGVVFYSAFGWNLYAESSPWSDYVWVVVPAFLLGGGVAIIVRWLAVAVERETKRLPIKK